MQKKTTEHKNPEDQSANHNSEEKWSERKKKARTRSEALRKIIQYFKSK
jgi:hypothetical protein